MSELVFVVVPEGIDDPTRPSGGNSYDRQLCTGLARLGARVRELAVPGSWPVPDAVARAALDKAITTIPAGTVTIVDGLIASAVPDVLVPHSQRLRLVVLVHLPLGVAAREARADECAVLSAACAVVTTSAWTRCWLLSHYPLPPELVHVAEPGVATAPRATGTDAGGNLLCVAAVTPHKGHDVLLAALATMMRLIWRCVCVGALDTSFADEMQRRASCLGGRVVFTGPRVGAALDAEYADTDLLVLASRGETYGMVVAEALARGIPVLATAVGGLPDTLGRGADGSRPGLLVPPDDSDALAGALTRWLADAPLRQRLRSAADERRTTLPDWTSTCIRVSRVLAGAAA